MNKTDERKERLRKVAEKLKEEREAEAEKDRLYFEKMTSGVSWKIFIGLAFFCALMAVLTGIDTFVNGKTKTLNEGQYYFDRSLGAYGYQSVWVNEDHIFLVPIDELVGFQEHSFKLTKSYIFGDNKYLTFMQEISSYNEDTYYVKRTAFRRISIYEWFPFLQIVLLIPLFVFIIKRQKPWYKFAQYACWLLIYPGTFILLLTLLF